MTNSPNLNIFVIQMTKWKMSRPIWKIISLHKILEFKETTMDLR